MKIDSTSAEPLIVMTRTLHAPRAAVWAAFTEPKRVAKWFGGRGFETILCEMDVRPGGIWRHVMRMPNGEELRMEVEYVVVVRPERLVWRSVAPPSNEMTVTLEAAGDETKWKLVVRFPSVADRDMANRIGFADVIAEGNDKLAELLEASS